MNIQLLHKHRFQFISFAPCFYDSLLDDYGRVEFRDDSHLLHITHGTGNILINHKRYELKRGTVIANLFYSDLKESDRRKIASENIERLMISVKAGGKKRKAILLKSLELKAGPSGTNGISSAAFSSRIFPMPTRKQSLWKIHAGY